MLGNSPFQVVFFRLHKFELLLPLCAIIVGQYLWSGNNTTVDIGSEPLLQIGDRSVIQPVGKVDAAQILARGGTATPI